MGHDSNKVKYQAGKDQNLKYKANGSKFGEKRGNEEALNPDVDMNFVQHFSFKKNIFEAEKDDSTRRDFLNFNEKLCKKNKSSFEEFEDSFGNTHVLNKNLNKRIKEFKHEPELIEEYKSKNSLYKTKSYQCEHDIITTTKKMRVCFNCKVTSTPSWRKSIDGNHLLCNACGLYQKLHKVSRPFSITPEGRTKAVKKDFITQSCYYCRSLYKCYQRPEMNNKNVCEVCYSKNFIYNVNKDVPKNTCYYQTYKNQFDDWCKTTDFYQEDFGFMPDDQTRHINLLNTHPMYYKPQHYGNTQGFANTKTPYDTTQHYFFENSKAYSRNMESIPQINEFFYPKDYVSNHKNIYSKMPSTYILSSMSKDDMEYTFAANLSDDKYKNIVTKNEMSIDDKKNPNISGIGYQDEM